MPDDKEIGERLAAARKAAGYETAAAAARSLGAPYPTYAGHENGSRGIRPNLEKYARRFNVSTDWLLTGDGVGPGTAKPEGVRGPVPLAHGHLPYAGVAGAGGFMPVDEYFNQDDGDHLVPLGVMAHPAYPKLKQSAWLIRGNSMDQAKILDGMWAVAAYYADYVDQIGELGNGTVVIVERTRHGGSERELTIKEVQFARKGMRLIPRSSDPKYQEIFVALDEDVDPDQIQVTILGVVLWVGNDFDPRTRG